jgi:hypothetical protein
MVGDSAMHALAWSDGTDKVLALNELAYQQLKRGRARVRRSALSHLATNAAEDSRTLEAIRENMLSPDPEMRLWSLEYAYLLPKQEVLERSIKVLEDLKIDPQDRGKHIETYLIVLSSFTDGAPAWFTQKIKALASQEKDPTAKPIYDSLVDRFRRNELRRAQDEHDRIFGRDP